MSYGPLYLLGDAAHVISPMGAKGMNLALYDAETFVNAARDYVKAGDDSGLRAYSEHVPCPHLAVPGVRGLVVAHVLQPLR